MEREGIRDLEIEEENILKSILDRKRVNKLWNLVSQAAINDNNKKLLNPNNLNLTIDLSKKLNDAINNKDYWNESKLYKGKYNK